MGNGTELGRWSDLLGMRRSSYAEAQLPVSIHLLLGGMLAATDPVAVCAVLNDLVVLISSTT